MPKKLGTFFVLFALALFVTGGLALLTSSEAHAAPHISLAGGTCIGVGCDNLDPHDTGCDNPVSTVSLATIRVADGSYVAEHWGNCETNWTWAILYNPVHLFIDYETLTLHRFGGNGLADTTITWSNADCWQDCWGNQLYTHLNLAQSCIQGPNMDQPKICAPSH